MPRSRSTPPAAEGRTRATRKSTPPTGGSPSRVQPRGRRTPPGTRAVSAPPWAAKGRPGQRQRGIPQRRSIGLPPLSLSQKVLLTLGLSLLVTIVVLLARGWILRFGDWGYLGAFLINVASSATILLPAPGAAVILVMGADFNPILLGLAGGAGSALGELTGYLVGMAGYHTVSRRRFYARVGGFVHRFGAIIFLLFSISPLAPLDMAGITAGATHYPVRKFLLYVAIGKAIKFTLIAYAGALSLEWISRWMEPLQ